MPTFKLPGLIGLACCVVTAGCAPSPEKLAPAFPDTTLRHVYAQTLAGELQAGRTVLVTFAFGSAELDETAKRALDVQARWLAANGDLFFTITGSADRVGPDAMNRDLGLRRAQAVADYLVRAGVAASRISVIGTTGEDSPLLNTEDETRLNRYVAISFLMPEGARSGRAAARKAAAEKAQVPRVRLATRLAEPVARLAEPVARLAEPVVRLGIPAARLAVRLAEPAARLAELAVRLVGPAVRLVEPVARLVGPAARLVEPAARLVEPAVRLVEIPAVRLVAQLVETVATTATISVRPGTTRTETATARSERLGPQSAERSTTSTRRLSALPSAVKLEATGAR